MGGQAVFWSKVVVDMTYYRDFGSVTKWQLDILPSLVKDFNSAIRFLDRHWPIGSLAWAGSWQLLG